jgi:hypothetical protein
VWCLITDILEHCVCCIFTGECSEMLVIKHHKLGNNPKDYMQHFLITVTAVKLLTVRDSYCYFPKRSCYFHYYFHRNYHLFKTVAQDQESQTDMVKCQFQEKCISSNYTLLCTQFLWDEKKCMTTAGKQHTGVSTYMQKTCQTQYSL